MQTIPIDWENYGKDFPRRYVDWGKFDDLVQKTILSFSEADLPLHVLDAGGGKYGSLALEVNQELMKTWLADPFIKEHPDWMKGNIGALYPAGAHIPPHFHLVVARGSFNYLYGNEIRTCAEFLRPDGIFLFNTFKEAKTGERPYETVTGKKGIERYFHEGEKIRHQLIQEHRDAIIEHEFFVYPKDLIEVMLAGWDLTFEEEGNSLHVSVRRPAQELSFL